MEAILFLIILFGGIFLYALPTVIASERKHKQVVAIGILNIFFGWLALPWIVALIWACMK